MAITRERALEAAVRLVGEQGVRALTHARVDDRGRAYPRDRPRTGSAPAMRSSRGSSPGWPKSSAPNSPQAAPRGSRRPTSWSTPSRDSSPYRPDRSPAEPEPAMRSSWRPTATRSCWHRSQQRALYVDWTAALLADIGAAHPAEAARTLMATGEGLVLHHLTIDPDAEDPPRDRARGARVPRLNPLRPGCRPRAYRCRPADPGVHAVTAEDQSLDLLLHIPHIHVHSPDHAAVVHPERDELPRVDDRRG